MIKDSLMERTPNKGVVGGYAVLDETGKVPVAQIPDGIGGAVDSVNSQTGDVVLTKTDVGLGNVDNTSDTDKPVSTATQTALDLKAASSHTHAPSDVTGTAVIDNDPRLTDSRTPTAHTHPQSEVTDLVTTLAAKETSAGAQAKVDTHAGVADAHLPTQTGNGGKFLTTNGSVSSWGNPPVSPPGGEAFPVGAVFISVVSTDPATLLGYGTWVAFGAGRVLVGLDAGDTDFDTAEETGGAKTVTLTAAQMPSHRHTLSNLRGATTGSQTTAYGGIAAGSDTTSTLTPYQMDLAGSGEAHSNLQPYIVCYFWKRTA